MALTISHRCQNIAPSPTLAIDARAKEMKAAGVDVIGFGAGEPDFPTPAYICDAAKEALDKGMTGYTPAAGTVALRQAICDKLERDNHLHYTPSDIIVSSGAKHSLYTIFQCILDPGAVNGNFSPILESQLHTPGIHVKLAGSFIVLHNHTLQILLLAYGL